MTPPKNNLFSYILTLLGEEMVLCAPVTPAAIALARAKYETWPKAQRFSVVILMDLLEKART
jgi:hypothetical protein